LILVAVAAVAAWWFLAKPAKGADVPTVSTGGVNPTPAPVASPLRRATTAGTSVSSRITGYLSGVVPW
jgi:hypothetical protein